MPPTPEASKKQYYAWSNFKAVTGADGKEVHGVIKCGDKVDQEMLGANNEQWKEWRMTGTVRTQPYPDIPDTLSPAEHHRIEAAKAAEGIFEVEEAEE